MRLLVMSVFRKCGHPLPKQVQVIQPVLGPAELPSGARTPAVSE
jgi:hypothetical protein